MIPTHLIGLPFILLKAVEASRNWVDLVDSSQLQPLDPHVIDYLIQFDPFESSNNNNNNEEDEIDEEEPSDADDDDSSPVPDPSDTNTDNNTTLPPLDNDDTPILWEPPELPILNITNTEPFPEKPLPAVPMPWYFNYDSTSNYGPGEIGLFSKEGLFDINVHNNHWGQVELAPLSYWEEFTANGWGPWKGVLDNHDPTNRNSCETGNMQSPIDVRENGGAICIETHEIHKHGGDFGVRGDKVRKEIHNNKLRLLYDRRPCADYLNNETCAEPDPPKADFPNGWGGYSDVLHVDFKVPGEHRIWNEQFDAEMQIFHIHPGRRRLPAQAVLIRAQEDGHNAYLEEVLTLFEYEYDLNQAKCARRLREQRRLHSRLHGVLAKSTSNDFHDDSWADFSTVLDQPAFDQEEHKRRLQRSVWNPQHPMLVPSIYFYRYDGSLTEPPCGEFVSWFVCDTPMIISSEQLERMKKILFTNVDENCRVTSIHHDESVARPIRPIGERPVWRCTEEHYGPS
jgi:carbonic anhydrase